MAEFTAELRVFGKSLDLDEVSRKLGLTPDLTWCEGDPRGNGTFDSSMWSYHGRGSDEEANYWADLETGLLVLVDKLEPARTAIRELAEHYQVVFWCGQFQSGWNGSFNLSNSTISRLAEFGAELFVDTYFSTHDG